MARRPFLVSSQAPGQGAVGGWDATRAKVPTKKRVPRRHGAALYNEVNSVMAEREREGRGDLG